MNADYVRHAVAAVAAVLIAAGVLAWLNGLSPGLTTGVWMRDTLALVGEGVSQYESMSGNWVLLRGLLGVYLTGLVATVSVLLLLSLRTHPGGVDR
ncbi:hypothetical protein HTSR_1574 [Halodesulfurarchaeum formicicum]|uniref:Uncharacterized protein n=1 Tax=Halodesulfurarchaeum formicicum TaxID=1873524 RepID=A0A1D8S5W0_9EURY|nr:MULTISPECIES: hypothetical protein [Halodesulfurarchaeum]AOW80746.1 hypothetical protein HTSR_1574 [Halodesulfurarchaeum formicicum]APE96082.1 hypothetical protein HSR6_1643 [Halodesulfurarchaeum formicicum]MDR5656654.1 hypothetical protein [Halodesulfurarchaeum sp. HSR-GB]